MHRTTLSLLVHSPKDSLSDSDDISIQYDNIAKNMGTCLKKMDDIARLYDGFETQINQTNSAVTMLR